MATARAAAALGVTMCLSTLSNRSMSDVAEACGDGPRWFQLYPLADMAANHALVDEAAALGYQAVIVTVDLPPYGFREREVRNPFVLPEGLDLPVVPPPPGGHGRPTPRETTELMKWDLDWSDIGAIAAATELPVVVKGILSPADAVLAADHGARGGDREQPRRTPARHDRGRDRRAPGGGRGRPGAVRGLHGRRRAAGGGRPQGAGARRARRARRAARRLGALGGGRGGRRAACSGSSSPRRPTPCSWPGTKSPPRWAPRCCSAPSSAEPGGRGAPARSVAHAAALARAASGRVRRARGCGAPGSCAAVSLGRNRARRAPDPRGTAHDARGDPPGRAVARLPRAGAAGTRARVRVVGPGGGCDRGFRPRPRRRGRPRLAVARTGAGRAGVGPRRREEQRRQGGRGGGVAPDGVAPARRRPLARARRAPRVGRVSRRRRRPGRHAHARPGRAPALGAIHALGRSGRDGVLRAPPVRHGRARPRAVLDPSRSPSRAGRDGSTAPTASTRASSSGSTSPGCACASASAPSREQVFAVLPSRAYEGPIQFRRGGMESVSEPRTPEDRVKNREHTVAAESSPKLALAA